MLLNAKHICITKNIFFTKYSFNKNKQAKKKNKNITQQFEYGFLHIIINYTDNFK